MGHRIKCRYRGQNLYVAIFTDKKEIFISMCEVNKKLMAQDQHTMAGIDTIARLSSKCWQAYGSEELLKQLSRASRTKHDLPGILSAIIADVVAEKQ